MRDIAAQVRTRPKSSRPPARGITAALEKIADDARAMRDLLERQLEETDRIADASRVMLDIAQKNDAIAREFNATLQNLVRSGHEFESEVTRFRYSGRSKSPSGQVAGAWLKGHEPAAASPTPSVGGSPLWRIAPIPPQPSTAPSRSRGRSESCGRHRRAVDAHHAAVLFARTGLPAEEAGGEHLAGNVGDRERVVRAGAVDVVEVARVIHARDDRHVRRDRAR